ncbi:CYTH and CHAD domain-containing protein [Streptomyces sp. NBC_00344]|uniref:CYTH and CHAD domain-containing protein n=1 Tax=Streptomyces sp. NBC_00344 TaxID=2975720 RepID=UPI002E1D8968
MADTKREIERKYEATGEQRLPELTRVPGVSGVIDRGVAELDAVYYDTADQRLAAGDVTLRRRTGGGDAGWHLKLPVAPDVRDEIRAPLADTVPAELSALVRARTRGAALAPVMRLRSSRDVRHLVDGKGALLAELSVDTVRADRLAGGSGSVSWTEIEVELADDGDPAILDAVDKRLRKAGINPSASASKLARALAETATAGQEGPRPQEPGTATAGGQVLGYLRAQAEAIVAHDSAVRRELPDSVHRMRVATRRLRSAFRSYRKHLDRTVTAPLADELKWLAAELGADRDQEVLAERLTAGIAAVPETLLLGPVRGRLRLWAVAGRTRTRRGTLAVLDSARYLALLESLAALLDDPPLRPAAALPAGQALPHAILRDYDRLAGRVEYALGLPPGPERDIAMHSARKAAKRTRYAAEAAKPALGRPAKKFAKRMKAVQSLLGDHQDSVVARDALRALAIQAHAAGEPSFVWGLLHGQEAASAAARERELPGVWAKASAAGLRTALGG